MKSLPLIGEPEFHVGDRIELNADAGVLHQGLLPLDPALDSFFSQPDVAVLCDSAGEPIPLRHDAEKSALKSVKALRPFAKKPGTLVLECESARPYRFRLRLEPTVSSPIPHLVDSIALADEDAPLLENGRSGLARWHDFRLSLQATRLSMVAGFEQLLCLPWLRKVDLLEHQLRAARALVRRGRLGQDDRGGPRHARTDHPGVGVPHLDPDASLAGRAVAGRDAAQVRPGFYRPR